MKSVYRGVITDEMKKQSEKINTHFERMQHEMQHGAYKPHKTVIFYGSDSRQQLVDSLVFTGLFFFLCRIGVYV